MRNRHHTIEPTGDGSCGCCRAIALLLGAAIVVGIALNARDVAKYLQLRAM